MNKNGAILGFGIYILALNCFANTPISFENKMIDAEKVILAKIAKVSKASVQVEIIEIYKGTFASKTEVIKKGKEAFYWDLLSKGDLCFMIIEKKYRFKYACGKHTLLIMKNDKISKGIFRFHVIEKKVNYEQNDPSFSTTKQISNEIKAKLEKKK